MGRGLTRRRHLLNEFRAVYLAGHYTAAAMTARTAAEAATNGARAAKGDTKEMPFKKSIDALFEQPHQLIKNQSRLPLVEATTARATLHAAREIGNTATHSGHVTASSQLLVLLSTLPAVVE